ncbi:hypothetical protein Pint_18250 [Pistacia integerrima]|uniref:Uncharacterized protein n=1 Tax=Pistacia integerrima TaxID=434235 RepID=A0ACC0Z112_9ROSI|nr:hypothetical protein Pint_18250 [Pistacia integerrima]
MSKDQCSSMAKAWEATIRKTQAARKRANSIFGTISVAHADDENDHEYTEKIAETYNVEKILPNGDYYTGQWYDNFPHGQGKYLWVDGCMYVGEWYKGKTMGKGRFSWPSGATYEGEFKMGFMDGNGTYTGSNGDTYKGQWLMNMKHGHGVKRYASGDWYDGEWRCGVQEGHGKYHWKNGNFYVGEWKQGLICGKGIFVWTNGNVYDGFWEDGAPKGNGTFKWPDESFYVGNWSKDPSEQNGNYFPSESGLERNLEWDPQNIYNVDLLDCRISHGEKVSVMPSQKKLAVWHSSKGDHDKPRRVSVDGRVSVGVERPLDRMQMWDGDDKNALPGRVSDGDLYVNYQNDHTRNTLEPIRLPRPGKRQGDTISKGHKNYDLMLNLQLGIRHSVGRPAPAASFDLKASAFDPKEKVWTKFPPEGTKHTPPHQSCEFKWKDYCPLVFRTLRKLFKVDPADYMISICGNDALRELSSPGKSGSFFYLTNDDRYMIKTIKKSELKVRFIIMGNLFCSEYTIHRRYDLKGSSLGRITDKPDTEINEYTILKDLDLNFIFRLHKSWFQEFCRQIDRDCEFLEQERIMDYSLLVGLHFRQTTVHGELIPSGAPTPAADPESTEAVIPRLSRVDMDQLLLDPARWASIRLGVNMPALVERTVRRNECEFQLIGEATGEYYEVIMFFGIIDILQDYDITKKLEHAYKSFHYDPTSISAVDPRQYSRRFRDFILNVFAEDA